MCVSECECVLDRDSVSMSKSECATEREREREREIARPSERMTIAERLKFLLSYI